MSAKIPPLYPVRIDKPDNTIPESTKPIWEKFVKDRMIIKEQVRELPKDR